MHLRIETTSHVTRQIGERVRAERERLGLRQDELALMAGVSTRVIHQVEHGKATSRLDSLIPVLEALGLSLELGRQGRRVDEEGAS
jgi:HTH-type transcriptional regulator / antitoxin HipB